MDDATDFAGAVLGRVPDVPAPFPQVSYDPDGDCIEVLLSGESYYARWLGGPLTVYLSQETGEIVGILVEGMGLPVAGREGP